MNLSQFEVSRGALQHNFKELKKLVPLNVKMLSVVKGNAYGHGIEIVSKILDAAGTDWFGVDNLDEALILRRTSVGKPILILGYILLADLKEAVEQDISFVVYNEETIRKLQSIKGKRAKVHLKVETGTNRQGIQPDKVLRLANLIKKNSDKIVIEGISTHFANIEDTLDPSFARQQLDLFEKTIKLLAKNGINPPLKHTAATAATILYKETHFNMVRVGIGLYGLWPSRETQIAANITNKKNIRLLPVLTWKTKVAQVKEIKPGESVGYGRAWFASRPNKIAILPVGYYDGVDRKLSNNGSVLIKGKFAPIVGRVAMNMMVVDITDIKGAKPEDEAVLIGRQGENEITAEEVAARIGTINYEIVSRINPYIPRVIVR